MVLQTNLMTTYVGIGNREDLIDYIFNVDPLDTPAVSMFQRATARAVLHEWQTQAYAAAAANAQLEGDDVDAEAATATVRLSNTCQISYKVPGVSRTQNVVRHAGRESEMSYQVDIRLAELKRDFEFNIMRNTAENTGSATVQRVAGSIDTWYETNVSRGVGGTSGGAGNTAATDGTQRAFTETLLQGVIQDVWTNGGDPDCVMVGAFNKRAMSAFTGNATRVKTAEDNRLVASIKIYESDWGELQVIPNRFQRSRDAHVLQKNMWAVAWLDPVSITPLGKLGDGDYSLVVGEWTLESRNQRASGIVADLNTS